MRLMPITANMPIRMNDRLFKMFPLVVGVDNIEEVGEAGDKVLKEAVVMKWTADLVVYSSGQNRI